MTTHDSPPPLPTTDALLARAAMASSSPMLVTDGEGRVLAANGAFTRYCGWSLIDLQSRSLAVLRSDRQDRGVYAGLWQSLADDGRWHGHLWNRTRSGQEMLSDVLIDRLPAASRAAGRVDVAENTAADIAYVAVYAPVVAAGHDGGSLDIASYDPLTVLPNRMLFLDHAHGAVARARRADSGLAVLVLDMDGFRDINRDYGYAVGDEVLKAVGARLLGGMREGDVVSRYAGDKFALLLPEDMNEAGARLAAERCRSAIMEPLHVGGEEILLTPNIGVALMPGDGSDPEGLLAAAEAAIVA
ncbi:MAG: diguanylate cyclase, partial [Alphaproteobacteria bacterium]